MSFGGVTKGPQIDSLALLRVNGDSAPDGETGVVLDIFGVAELGRGVLVTGDADDVFLTAGDADDCPGEAVVREIVVAEVFPALPVSLDVAEWPVLSLVTRDGVRQDSVEGTLKAKSEAVDGVECRGVAEDGATFGGLAQDGVECKGPLGGRILLASESEADVSLWDRTEGKNYV